jgi:hypothetical protein
VRAFLVPSVLLTQRMNTSWRAESPRGINDNDVTWTRLGLRQPMDALRTRPLGAATSYWRPRNRGGVRAAAASRNRRWRDKESASDAVQATTPTFPPSIALAPGPELVASRQRSRSPRFKQSAGFYFQTF